MLLMVWTRVAMITFDMTRFVCKGLTWVVLCGMEFFMAQLTHFHACVLACGRVGWYQQRTEGGRHDGDEEGRGVHDEAASLY